jgi:hypothetical protein
VGIRKGSLWLTVAILMATVCLLYEPRLGISQTAGPIDLTGNVDASQCAPCHLRISDAIRPGLIFSHGNHLMVACSACHPTMPHEAGKTNAPTMEACFNCHGVPHGPQGQLALGSCPACHEKSFKLRPADHVAKYAGKPHAEAARSNLNRCMMCHTAAKDCDACHIKQDVRIADGSKIGSMPSAYVPIVPLKVKRPSVIVYPDRPTSMGQCIYCHPDIDAFAKGKVIFAHSDHLRRDYKCTVCHPTFGHGAEQINRPPMETCYSCHGLVHAARGLVATEACDKCHPKSFPLKPPNHTPAFEGGDHKKRAEVDQEYCAMCHKSQFCIDCHQGRRLLANGSYSRRVIPADHRRGDWMGKHGPLYLQQKGACASCHDSKSCTTCHYTPMPHPANWPEQHGAAARRIDTADRDCNVCHTDRERCQNCHHGGVKSKALVASACVGCHAIMKQTPATSIKNKAFAEHAVHFNVQKSKGKPYQCNDCHVGFGTGQTTAGAPSADLKQAGHDVRLCYGCHGALDFENVRIAPYSGAALCIRCHRDLNV